MDFAAPTRYGAVLSSLIPEPHTMHPQAARLLEAQLAFFLAEFEGERLRQNLAIEAEAYCDLLENVSVRELLSPDDVIGWIERNVLAYEPTEGFRRQAVLLFEMGLNNPSHQQLPMRQLLNRQIYDLMVERLISRPALREELIHGVLGSPVYHQLLSDVLYHSITDYLVTANPLSRNVPGVSSLMKVGKGVMSKLGGLDQAVESTLKTYIQANIRATADYSEKLLDKALSNDKLRALADALWPRLEAYELGQATRHLEIEGLSYMAMVFWNQIRQTDYMKAQVRYLVNAWYEHTGNTPAMDVLTDLGIPREQVVREVIAIGRPLLTAWTRSGYIERRLREHLQHFYLSPAAQHLWDSP